MQQRRSLSDGQLSLGVSKDIFLNLFKKYQTINRNLVKKHKYLISNSITISNINSCFKLHHDFIISSLTMSKWNPHAQCLSVADLKALSHTNVESLKANQESTEEFQEIFLNFHFSGSSQRLERPSVNTIHFITPPEALQVETCSFNDKDSFIFSICFLSIGFLYF